MRRAPNMNSRAALDRNNAELMRSPGVAWMEIIREDFKNAVDLRNEVNRFDASNERNRHEFLRNGAQLISDAQTLLQAPARNALAAAAQRAAQAANNAQHALVTTGITVELVVVLVSLVLALRISVPVKRLTVATRRLAAGERAVTRAAAVRPKSPSWPMPSMRWQARSAPRRVGCAPIRRCWNSMSRIAPAPCTTLPIMIR